CVQGIYFGDISLGTPPQSFRMLLSMAIPTVWIPNFRYSTASRHYNHSQSSTYTVNGTAFEMKGLIAGHLSQDTMRIGELAIEHQGFVEIDTINDKLLPPDTFGPCDGMFGLGFDLGGGASQIRLPFHSLVDSGVLREPLFALYYNNHAGQGAMSIGATDPSHYTGELAYAEVIRQDSWTVKLDDIRVDGRNMTKHRRATFWAGYPEIQGPAAEVAALAQAVGAKRVARGPAQIYEIECSSQGPDIEILIAGARFALSKSDYTGPVLGRDGDDRVNESSDGAMCRWAIQEPFFGMDAWLFGGVFIEKVYSVFHWGDPAHDGRGRKMGFALRA
ncbi:hypothetical protein PybrP1_002575, partial [[Pythium] brassicae (nom. inval.)]